jgi:mRNA-degrading endonuclease toxin of MazEF toxin-antitoxin module
MIHSPKRGDIWLKVSSADTLQARSVSLQRFIKKLGTVDQDIMAQITAGLMIVVEH